MSAVIDRSIKRKIEIKSLNLGNVKFIVDLDKSRFDGVLRMKA